MDKEEFTIGGEKVTIDPENLEFNENTLTDYIIKEGGYYNNFGGYLARAERIMQRAEVKADQIFNERFVQHKEKGGAVALCEAQAKSDPEYIKLKEFIVETKYIVNRLKTHLRAWDKNHENAQSLGHMLRKEMDKLNADIRFYGGFGDSSNDYEAEVEKVVGHIDTKEEND